MTHFQPASFCTFTWTDAADDGYHEHVCYRTNPEHTLSHACPCGATHPLEQKPGNHWDQIADVMAPIAYQRHLDYLEGRQPPESEDATE